MNVYKYTFRFNASHSNTNDMTKVHTHSFVVAIYLKYDQHMMYDKIEKDVKECLSKYKGKCLNNFLSKDAVIENIADYLFEELDQIVGENNLISLELSDSPVQLFRIRRTG